MSEKVSPQVGISTRNQPKYAPGEKILCFHGALIYEAKVNTRKYYNNCNRQRKAIYYTNELKSAFKLKKLAQMNIPIWFIITVGVKSKVSIQILN